MCLEGGNNVDAERDSSNPGVRSQIEHAYICTENWNLILRFSGPVAGLDQKYLIPDWVIRTQEVVWRGHHWPEIGQFEKWWQ